MSDTMSEATRSIAFVRTQMLPEKSPPVTAVGAIGWARANLFTGWFNTLLTLASLYFIYAILASLLPWILSPTWNAGSLTECREIFAAGGEGGHGGACWGVIRERWVQFIFGFYPADLYWRPLLAFVLLAVALAPVLFSNLVPARLIWFSALYPFIFPWLMWGGSFWVPLLVLLGLVLGYVAYKLTVSSIGNLGALIVSVLVPVIWWALLMPVVESGLNATIGSMRMESRTAALQAEIPVLQAEVDALDSAIKELDATINTRLADEKARHVTDKAAMTGFLDDIVVQRTELSNLRRDYSLQLAHLNDKTALLRRINALPELEKSLPQISQQAIEGRAALDPSVADIHSEVRVKLLREMVRSKASSVTPENLKAINDLVKLEATVKNTEAEIANTYSEVARIGPEPVNSRNFGGFMLSITIGIVAIAGSLPLGILLALGRQSDLIIVKALCVGFIEFIRGVPLITLLFVASTLLNIFLPPGTSFDIILRVLIMVTLFAAAYMAEVIRGGLAALPKGQYEGADSLGLDYWQAQRLIIMPQALKISIPGIVSTFIGVFKDTTLVSIIGLVDPLGLSTGIRADSAWNGIVWELYGFIALIFFIFCFSMSRYSMYLERKLQTGHR